MSRSIFIATVFIACSLVVDCLNSHLGAVVTLARNEDLVEHSEGYKKLIERNKSLKFLSNLTFDVIIFYEKSFTLSDNFIDRMRSETPMLTIKFVSVVLHTSVVKSKICPPSPLSEKFSIGYKGMCHFWSIDFPHYLHNYDWAIRIDGDCYLLSTIQSFEFYGGRNKSVALAAPVWQDLDNPYSYSDFIKAYQDGPVTTGLNKFIQQFYKTHDLGFNNHTLFSVRAPYTNSMYIDLKWYRMEYPDRELHESASIVHKFMHAVHKSECIFSNRWGDMPLWGAALALARLPVVFIRLPYVHSSHNHVVDDKPRFRNDPPGFLHYTDHKHVNFDAAIMVPGSDVYKFQNFSESQPCQEMLKQKIMKQELFLRRTIDIFAGWNWARDDNYIGDSFKIDPWDFRKGMYLWDWFLPTAPCEFRERIGNVGNGGKFVCDVERYVTLPPRRCVVYSFGITEDNNFESELHERTSCDVFIFDRNAPQLVSKLQNMPRLNLLRKSLGTKEMSVSGEFWTLRQIMQHYNHTFIDILKVDIDGNEYGVFRDVFEEFGDTVPIEQLLLQIHAEGHESDTFTLMKNLYSRGMVPFTNEVNHNPCVMSQKKPFIVEYSFYNEKSWFNISRWKC